MRIIPAITAHLLVVIASMPLLAAPTYQEGEYVRLQGVVRQADNLILSLSTDITLRARDGSRTVNTNYIDLPRASHLADGATVDLCGRIDFEPARETLTGLTYVHEGEPCYNGQTFTSAAGDQLPVARLPADPRIADLPDEYLVADVAAQKLFVAYIGGYIYPGTNPFHGLRAVALRAPIAGEAPIDRDNLTDLHLSYSGTPSQDTLLLDLRSAQVHLFDAAGQLVGSAYIGDVTDLPPPPADSSH